MRELQIVWAFLARYWVDEALAAFFGLFFLVLFELFSLGSRLRGVLRHVRNKLSEQSAVRLRKRIRELELYRESLVSFMSSDKALYLHTFRYVIAILVFMCLGACCLVLDYIGIFSRLGIPGISPFVLGALAFLAVAAAAGIQGLRIAALDTRAKVSDMAGKLDTEIGDLKAKLNSGSQ